jgi:DNA-binding transcriptional MerR regulator
MARQSKYRVKEVAELTGVSVRTLHHYDAIGLLSPSQRSGAGYRLYDAADLLRLQQVLIGRELGLSLEDIRRSLDEASFDRKRALLEQRKRLQERAAQTEAMLRAIDAALTLIDQPTERGDDIMQLKEMFDGFDPTQYEAEVEQRWGDSDAYKVSKQRTSRYTPEDWKRQAAEQAAVYGDAFRALQAGKMPDDPEVMDVAERHRLAIDRWFYPCSHAQHAGLADMYEQDRRFAENIDKFGADLTPFLAAAIRANARRHGG